MQTYGAMEQGQQIALKMKDARDNECLSCPTCQSQWFEEVQAQRFQSEHHLIVGQKVPPKPGTIPYQILRCMQCLKLLEPRVIHNTRDIAGDDYDNFLDTLEGKFDPRTKQLSEEEIKVAELNTELVALKAELENLRGAKVGKNSKKKTVKDELQSQE